MTFRKIVERLRDAGVETAEWDAALLCEHFFGRSKEFFLTDPETECASPDLENALARRCAREPLQYLLGTWDFYRQTYEVSPDCLIPRSDTEVLVEQAIRLLPAGAVFADFCTGSGCIAVSTLAERPDTEAFAVDLFPRTLELAARNAARNGVSERFHPMQADLLSASPTFPRPLDAILCNPPYIRTDDLPTLAPELCAEPRAALDGGSDGLIFYRAIARMAPALLKAGGFLLFEIGADQAREVAEIGRAAGFADPVLARDLGGRDRTLLFRMTDLPS